MNESFDELSELLGASAVDDPYPMFAEYRRTTPVLEGDLLARFGVPAMAAALDGSRPMYTVFRYEDIMAALRDPATFSNESYQNVFRALGGGTSIVALDGAIHSKMRGLALAGFTRRLLAKWQEEILRPVARAAVDSLAATPGKRADLVPFTLQFPVRMIYQVIGFPEDEQTYEEFATAGVTMLLAMSGMNPSDPESTRRAIERATAASQELWERVHEIVVARRAAGADQDDLIGHLLRAEFEGAALDDDQVTTMCRNLVAPATETTSRSFLNILHCLFERPDVLEQVRSDRSLVPLAIEEGMRYEAAGTVLGRIATRDTEIRGVPVPAGAGVTLVVGSGNRDELAFDEADTFDVSRKGPPHMSFGFGIHICIGAATARTEMAEILNAMLDRLPNLRFDPTAEKPEIRGLQFRSPRALPITWD